MKLILLALATFAISGSAHGAESDAKAKLKLEVMRSNKISAKIYEAVQKQVRLSKLESFKINWASLDCVISKEVAAQNESEGACVVTADAMHVSAQMIIIKNEKGTTTFVSSYDAE